MDALDLSILREMTRGKVLFWTALDPRVSAERIARRLRVAPSTVRARFAGWRERGFLAGLDVVPHPALLGVTIGTGSVRVDDPRAKARVLADLALVPGCVNVLDHVGPWLALALLRDSAAGLERRRALVARLPGVDEVTPCTIVDPRPPARTSLSALDWRVLRALRADPERPMREAAKEAGVSSKTFARRYAALVDDRAALFIPIVDFSKAGGGTVVRFLVELAPDADRGSIARRAARLPGLMDAPDPEGLLAEAPRFSAWLLLPSAGDAEATQRAMLDWPGVVTVEPVFPVRGYHFSAWVDDLIDRAAAKAGTGA